MDERFKFRAWNKVKKKMYYNLTSFLNRTGYDYFGDILEDDDFFCMQSTGIKDKNGELIYEGDILYEPSWWWGNCFVYYLKGQYILTRNIENPLESLVWGLWDGKDVEVIGNIYENPELLEGKNAK